MVRLKENQVPGRADKAGEFQFHYGTIKRLRRQLCRTAVYCFNSTMVRLKGSVMAFQMIAFLRFNSTMVRLKALRMLRSLHWSRCFNSTMVRLKVMSPLTFPVPSKFQFHYGTIKRVFSFAWNISIILFQFHYGTIKSWTGIRQMTWWFCFNSTMVRLKGTPEHMPDTSLHVSIPLWYD